MARSAPRGRDAQRPVAGAEMRNDNGSHPRRKVPARGSRDTRRQGAMRRRACLVVLVLAGPASGAEPFAPDPTSPPGMLVGIGSHRLHIHCTGRGAPAVVFESGLGGTSLDWIEVQPAVSGFTLACSYDRAGYGWSESGPRPRHVARLAAELDKLLVYASVPPPYVLVGHSFGGLAIRLLAARKERREVAGLVLVDAAHERQFQRMAAAGVRVPMAPTGRTFMIANHWLVPTGLPETLKPLAQRLALAPKAVRALYGELGRIRDSALQVGAIRRTPTAPVVVLARGPRRDGGSIRTARLDGTWLDLQHNLARRMQNGTLQVVPGSGHYIHLDRPDRVVAAIRAMVDAFRIGQKPGGPSSPMDPDRASR